MKAKTLVYIYIDKRGKEIDYSMYGKIVVFRTLKDYDINYQDDEINYNTSDIRFLLKPI
jgi:hypothetical protein